MDPLHNPLAEAMQIAREEAAVRERTNAPLNYGGLGGGGGPIGPMGIGNLSGWATFFMMLAAIFFGIMGRSAIAAFLGAALTGGLFYVAGSLSKSTKATGISRLSVLRSTLFGAAAGAVFGVFYALAMDIFMDVNVTANRAGNMILNFTILGALVLGGLRLSKRNRD
jgi:hypothetical protein